MVRLFVNPAHCVTSSNLLALVLLPLLRPFLLGSPDGMFTAGERYNAFHHSNVSGENQIGLRKVLSLSRISSLGKP